MNLIPFLADAGTCDAPEILPILYYATKVVTILQIAAPIALIIWGTIDLLKGIIAGDEKKISAAKKPFIQRLISAVIIFLIPWIVNWAIDLFVSDTVNWKACYSKARDASGFSGVSSKPDSVKGVNKATGQTP